MTVATTNYRNEYSGDCSTTTFGYTFRILDKSHLEVYVAGVLQTITTDYTVTGVDSAAGGNVVFAAPPNLKERVVIVRDVPFTQTTSYVEGSSFPAASHEKAIDKLTMALQVVEGLVLRSWRFAASSPYAANGYTVDEPKGGSYVRIKSDCSGVEYVALQNCGTYANPVTTKGDLIRGNDLGEQERLALGGAGTVLVAASTGKPEWGTIGLPLLRNKTDAQADAGRFFAISLDCDSAVVTSDVTGCTRVGVITSAAVGDDCNELFVFGGARVTMLAQGNIARGHYVKKGTTEGAVVTTCVSTIDIRPIPRGTLGLALGHSTGNCVPVLTFGVPAGGNQGVPAVRRNRSASVAATPCTQVSLVADYLTLVDSCNDVVVVKGPADLTHNVCTSFTNKKNGRDNTEIGGGFQAGDIHFYWTYEGPGGTVYSRSSTKGPETSGPELPTCETHWAYSHSLYWDSNCLRRHTVRGHSVFFDCTDSTRILNAGAATCETRVNFPTVVPAIATRVRFNVRVADTSSALGEVYLGYRLNCIAMVLGPSSPTTSGGENGVAVDLPNNNQEIFYRQSDSSMQTTISVLGFDVPSGDS